MSLCCIIFPFITNLRNIICTRWDPEHFASFTGYKQKIRGEFCMITKICRRCWGWRESREGKKRTEIGWAKETKLDCKEKGVEGEEKERTTGLKLKRRKRRKKLEEKLKAEKEASVKNEKEEAEEISSHSSSGGSIVSTDGGSFGASMVMLGWGNTVAEKTANMATKSYGGGSGAAKKPSLTTSKNGYPNGGKPSYSQQSIWNQDVMVVLAID